MQAVNGRKPPPTLQNRDVVCSLIIVQCRIQEDGTINAKPITLRNSVKHRTVQMASNDVSGHQPTMHTIAVNYGRPLNRLRHHSLDAVRLTLDVHLIDALKRTLMIVATEWQRAIG